MRIARFNIRKETKNGYTFWKIHVPKWVNPSGKDGYAYFHTKAEAERKCGELIAAEEASKPIRFSWPN